MKTRRLIAATDDRGPGPYSSRRGNFADQLAPEKGWYTFDSRPRFGNNYVGLRNRFVILSEAYSYIDFKMRTEVTWHFCHTILDFVKDHGRKMMKLVGEADREIASGAPKELGVRFEIRPWRENVEILWERCVEAPWTPRRDEARFTGQATSCP